MDVCVVDIGAADIARGVEAVFLGDVESGEPEIGECVGARVGDLVTVYGDADSGARSATDLAETIGTIGEEIALRVSPLVPRNYR